MDVYSNLLKFNENSIKRPGEVVSFNSVLNSNVTRGNI